MNPRLSLLLLALAATLWAAFGDDPPLPEVVKARVPPERPAEAAPKDLPADAGPTVLVLAARSDLIRAASAPSGRDLFATRSWTPPLPPPVPASAPAPGAPPLPFAYLGKKIEAGTWEVYLSRGDATVVARPGQVIDGQYKVVAIEPPTLRLNYLPMNLPQTLSIGDAP